MTDGRGAADASTAGTPMVGCPDTKPLQATLDSSRQHLDFAAPLRETSNKAHTREVSMTMLKMLPAVLAAGFVLAAGSGRREMKTQWVEYSHGDTKLKAYMAYDDKVTGKRPAVFMVHARDGMTPTTLAHAETWAKLGYVSFATDIFGYGQGVLPKDVPEMQAQTDIYSKNRTL